MNKLTPIEKLDLVLAIINKYPNGITLENIFLEVKNSTKTIIDGHELSRILDKLENDKYILPTAKRIKDGDPSMPIHYSITFDGDLFIQKGKYKQKFKDESISLNRQSLETKLISYGSALAAAGAFALFFLEVVKFVHQHHCCWDACKCLVK